MLRHITRRVLHPCFRSRPCSHCVQGMPTEDVCLCLSFQIKTHLYLYCYLNPFPVLINSWLSGNPKNAFLCFSPSISNVFFQGTMGTEQQPKAAKSHLNRPCFQIQPEYLKRQAEKEMQPCCLLP